jgi:hypothetical protein
MKHCPQCWSEQVNRSRRNTLLEKSLFTMIFLKPFRCSMCSSRFYAWSFNGRPT